MPVKFFGRRFIVYTALLDFVLIAGVCLIALAQGVPHKQQPTPSATQTVSSSPAASVRPLVLIAGGIGTVMTPTGTMPAVLDSAEIYDPARGHFSPLYPMMLHRDRHAAAVLPNGNVLIVGGLNAVIVSVVLPGNAMPWILSSTEMFYTSTGQFAYGPSMSVGRDGPTLTMLGNADLLVTGGGVASADLYNPYLHKFQTAGEMKVARYGQTATLLRSGRVLITGGGDPRTELYYPDSNQFSFTGAMSTNRILHTATLLNDGKVLIAGGSPYARSAALNSSEIYNVATETFSPGPPMTVARAGHTATLLADGRVLIAGGSADSSAELYDPTRGRFVAIPPMSVSRYAHTATRLPDGKVLIAGGWDQNYVPLPSAELFDPASDRFMATGTMTNSRADHSATLISAKGPLTWTTPTPTTTSTPTPTLTPTPTASTTAKSTPSQREISTPTRSASPISEPKASRSTAAPTPALRLQPPP